MAEEEDRKDWENLDVGLGEVNNIRLLTGCADDDFEFKDPIDKDWKEKHAAMDKETLLALLENAKGEVAQMVGVAKKVSMDYNRVRHMVDEREDSLQAKKMEVEDLETEKMLGWERDIKKLRGYIGKGGASRKELESDLAELSEKVLEFTEKKKKEKEAHDDLMKEIKEEMGAE